MSITVFPSASRTVPVITALTPSRCAIDFASDVLPLNAKTELREITFRFGRRDKLETSVWVIPSATYSLSESPPALAKGRTASESMLTVPSGAGDGAPRFTDNAHTRALTASTLSASTAAKNDL